MENHIFTYIYILHGIDRMIFHCQLRFPKNPHGPWEFLPQLDGTLPNGSSGVRNMSMSIGVDSTPISLEQDIYEHIYDIVKNIR